MFLRKGVLKICSKFTVEYPCQSVILIKLQKTLLKSYFSMVVLQWICCKLNNTLELLYVAASDFQKVVGKKTVKKTNLRCIHRKNLLKLTECCHGKINRFLAHVSILHPFHCVKSVRIQSYSGLHFPTTGPNTQILVNPNVRKCGRTRITPNTDTFYAVFAFQGYKMGKLA